MGKNKKKQHNSTIRRDLLLRTGSQSKDDEVAGHVNNYRGGEPVSGNKKNK